MERRTMTAARKVTKVWMLKQKSIALFSPPFRTKKDAEHFIAVWCLGCEVKGGYRPVQVELREIKP